MTLENARCAMMIVDHPSRTENDISQGDPYGFSTAKGSIRATESSPSGSGRIMSPKPLPAASALGMHAHRLSQISSAFKSGSVECRSSSVPAQFTESTQLRNAQEAAAASKVSSAGSGGTFGSSPTCKFATFAQPLQSNETCMLLPSISYLDDTDGRRCCESVNSSPNSALASSRFNGNHSSNGGMATSKKGFMFRLFHHQSDHGSNHSTHSCNSPPNFTDCSPTPHDACSSSGNAVNSSSNDLAQSLAPPINPPTPSRKHRFHLDHLFKDLLHHKSGLTAHHLHNAHRSAASLASSDGECENTEHSGNPTNCNNSGGSSGDEQQQQCQKSAPRQIGGLVGTAMSNGRLHSGTIGSASSQTSSRRGSRSDSTGRVKAAFDSVFKHLLMPPKQSTRAAKAAAAESGSGSEKSCELSLKQKYGSCGKIIGRGAGGVVRLCSMVTGDGRQCAKVFAVKEFKRNKNESERDYIKKLTSEFCISSRLHHENIIETVDLIQDENNHWCEIMEYCPHGDLYEAIKAGNLRQCEIDCYFKQLISGVEYLHSVGVAHRDLKPENLLINPDALLKITDFGVSDVFQIAWEKRPHYSKGVCGSEPYIAPEEFTGEPYDAREVDVWATGIIYYAMNFTGVPWKNATKTDPNYAYYLKYRGGRFEPFMRFPPGARCFMQRILEPDPKKRVTIAEMKEHAWFSNLETCHGAGVDAETVQHSHTSLLSSSSSPK